MSRVLEPVRNVFAARELLWNLTLRELRTKYRRSFLGWTWSMLNPLATVAIYTFVFGYLLGSEAPVGNPSELHTFSLYLLCGLLPWNFFTMVTSLGMGSLLSNAALVRKVAFPREVLVFANAIHGLVQFGIELMLLLVVMLIAGSMFLPWLPVIALQILFLLLFSSGVALGLAAVNVYFRDIGYLWEIFTRVLFFATPIIYSVELIEDQVAEPFATILHWNPMAIFVRGFRHSIYDGAFAGWSELLASFIVAALAMSIGWTIFTKMSRRFAEEL